VPDKEADDEFDAENEAGSGTLIGGGTFVRDLEEALRCTSFEAPSPNALGAMFAVVETVGLMVPAVVGVGPGVVPLLPWLSVDLVGSWVGEAKPTIPLIAEEMEVVRGRLWNKDPRTDAGFGASWVGVVTLLVLASGSGSGLGSGFLLAASTGVTLSTETFELVVLGRLEL